MKLNLVNSLLEQSIDNYRKLYFDRSSKDSKDIQKQNVMNEHSKPDIIIVEVSTA
jgi:hypothetical protein